MLVEVGRLVVHWEAPAINAKNNSVTANCIFSIESQRYRNIPRVAGLVEEHLGEHSEVVPMVELMVVHLVVPTGVLMAEILEAPAEVRLAEMMVVHLVEMMVVHLAVRTAESSEVQTVESWAVLTAGLLGAPMVVLLVAPMVEHLVVKKVERKAVPVLVQTLVTTALFSIPRENFSKAQ